MNDNLDAKELQNRPKDVQALEKPQQLFFAEYDATGGLKIDQFLNSELDIHTGNVHQLLTVLRDFALLDLNRTYYAAKRIGVPFIFWKGRETDESLLNGTAVIVQFPNETSQAAGIPRLPITEDIFSCEANVATICALVKECCALGSGDDEYNQFLNGLNNAIDDRVMDSLQLANYNRILESKVLQEAREDIVRKAKRIPQELVELTSWNRPDLPEDQGVDWVEAMYSIHDFLIQPMPEVATEKYKYYVEKTIRPLYELVEKYVLHPEIPRELRESVIAMRIIPDLHRQDWVSKEMLRHISHLSHPIQGRFVYVLAFSAQQAEVTASVSQNWKLFENPEVAGETIGELYKYSAERSSVVEQALWSLYYNNADKGVERETGLITGFADSMMNRILNEPDPSALLKDLVAGFSEIETMGKRGMERVMYAVNRISYYLYQQQRLGGELIDKDTQRAWFTWASMRDGNHMDSWTIRSIVGMPDDVVDSEQKSTLVKYLYDKAIEWVEPLYMNDGSQKDVLVSRDEVSVLSSIMKDPTTPLEVRQMIASRIILPFLQNYSLDGINQSDVDSWSETTYDRAKQILERLRGLLSEE